MKKNLLLLLAVIGLVSCKKAPETVSVPFEKLEHYFAIVDVPSPVTRKITDQAVFDGLFDVGYVMGSQQAPLDFGKEFVIAVMYPPTYEETSITPVSLVKGKDGLVFTYGEKIGVIKSSSSRPCLLLRVDKQYDEPLQVVMVKN